jgi:hypothetical protein
MIPRKLARQFHFVLAMFVLFVYVFYMRMTKRTGKVKRAKAATPPAQNIKPKPSEGAQVVHLENPPPEYLLEEAMKEPDRKLLEEYIQAIKVLRDNKRFTFREIADWLKQYGVIADHNAIYRAYLKSLPERDAAALADAHEEEERNAD